MLHAYLEVNPENEDTVVKVYFRHFQRGLLYICPLIAQSHGQPDAGLVRELYCRCRVCRDLVEKTSCVAAGYVEWAETILLFSSRLVLDVGCVFHLVFEFSRCVSDVGLRFHDTRGRFWGRDVFGLRIRCCLVTLLSFVWLAAGSLVFIISLLQDPPIPFLNILVWCPKTPMKYTRAIRMYTRVLRLYDLQMRPTVILAGVWRCYRSTSTILERTRNQLSRLSKARRSRAGSATSDVVVLPPNCNAYHRDTMQLYWCTCVQIA